MSPPLLRVERLAKSFGVLVATDDVNFTVNEGRLVALIGPNGAGKTTLINQLSGALQSDAGQILFGGDDITALDMPARAELGLVRSFQIAAVLPEYSALENVALAAQARSGSSFRFFGYAAREEALNAPARAAVKGSDCSLDRTSWRESSRMARSARSRSRWRSRCGRV